MSDTLISKIRNCGFDVDTIILDGAFHRFRTADKPRKKNGWYKGWEITFRKRIIQNVCVGDFRSGASYHFSSEDDSSLSPHELKLMQEARRKRDIEWKAKRKELWAAAAKKASKRWDNGFAVKDGFEYLKKKGIEGFKAIELVKLAKGGSSILVPLYNIENELRSIQTISADGKVKRFMKDGQIGGNFLSIPGSGEKCVVCEGFATGVSIHEALSGEVSVMVAFSGNNLDDVCRQMVLKFGAENVFIAADNDQYGDDNPGLESAEKCKKFGVRVIIPNFEAVGYSTKPTDFNDLHTLCGLNAVTEQLSSVLFRNKENENQSQSQSQGEQKANENKAQEEEHSGECLWPSKDVGFFIYIPNKNEEKEGKWEPRFMELSYYFRDELRLRASDAFCLIWRETHYATIERNEIFNLIIELTLSRAKPWQLDHFYKMIKAVCNASSLTPLIETEGKINLKNGILDVKSKNLSPHSSDFDFKYCLPYEYNPKAECPKWNKYLNEVFEGDSELIDLAAESFGYTVLGGDPFLHTAFMLYGDGRNGKSVFIFMLEQILGPKNYTNKSIDSLGEKFSRASLLGKVANLAGETSKREIDSGPFKQIVGGDNIDASFKGKDEFEFKPTCRIFFSCNEFPTFKDSTGGMTSRLVILPFNRIFDESEQIKDLKYQIAADELSGIFNWSMVGLDRVIANQRLTSPNSVRNIKDEYRKESCSVFDFLTTECDETKMPLPVEIKDFYQFYKIYCEKTDRGSRGLNQFSKKMSAYLTARNGRGAVDRSTGNCAQTHFLSLKSTIFKDKKESKNGPQKTSSSGKKVKNYAEDIEEKKCDASQDNLTHTYRNTLM